MNVWLKIGDVVLHERREWVVDMVNECRARCQPMSKVTRVIHDRFRGDVVRDFASKPISIAPQIDSASILRRIGRQEVDALFSQKRSGGTEGRSSAQTTNNERNDTVKAKTQNEKPLAGRAPFIHKLRDAKVGKAEAYEQTRAKFNCSKAAFDKVWDASPRGSKAEAKKIERITSKPAKATPPAKAKKAPAAKVAAAKATPPPPAPKATPPPPPAAPAPAPAAAPAAS